MSGALAVECPFDRGPTQDFNLRVRSVPARDQKELVRGALAVFAQNASVCALWTGAKGAVLRDTNGLWPVPAQTLAWCSSAPVQVLHIDSADALYMEIAPCL